MKMASKMGIGSFIIARAGAGWTAGGFAMEVAVQFFCLVLYASCYGKDLLLSVAVFHKF